ncbi:hypothetical protein C8R44DRAFT_772432 [Mycena epipterygia]|nr:hypothetical protein C8R44DRAFT_772432 [Mycena epipterygia]
MRMSELQSSLLLGALALISNNALRYTTVGLVVTITLIFSVHLKCLSTQLYLLTDKIQETEEILRNAKSQCARDILGLVQEEVRLLEIKSTASVIQCRVWETPRLTWKQYRVFSGHISECERNTKKIRTAIQMTVEAARRRKYTEDINEAQIILAVGGASGTSATSGQGTLPVYLPDRFCLDPLTSSV